MRTSLVCTGLLSTVVSAHLLAQSTPAHRRSAASAAPTTVSFTVTDPGGAPLSGVKVSGAGPVFREMQTTAGGITRFLNVKPGDYRLRLEYDGFITLERDITVKGGTPLAVDVTLDPAPEAPAPAAEQPPRSTDSTSAPPGEPRSFDLVSFLERNGLGKDPIKTDRLGCTASAATSLVQVRDDVKEQSRPDADEVLYVVAGEGTLRLGNKDVPLSAASLAVVPRGTARGLTRQGKNPLILLSVVSGKACTAK